MQIPKAIHTLELCEVPPRIVTVEDFPGKISIRSKLNVIQNIHNWLTERERVWFRRYPQLGRLIDLPTKGNFSGALMHHLLLRRMECQKEHEVWFSAEGKPLRFSLNEFALITGLYTSGGPSQEEIKSHEVEEILMNKYWPGANGVTVDDVAKKLEELSKKKVKSKDRVRLAFVYMIAGFLMAGDPRKKINSSWLQYAADLNFFDQYPWGIECYDLTLTSLKKINLAEKWEKRCEKNKKGPENYDLYGCPWIFQVRFSLYASIVFFFFSS